MADMRRLYAELDSLDTEALIRVQKRVGARLSQTGLEAARAEEALSSPELFVLATFADYVKKAGLGVEGVERLRAASNFPAFRQKIGGLWEFIEKQKCNQNEKRLLIRFGFQLLHEHITKSSNIAADARTLMNWVHRMPAVFDAHFPGYGRNGLLGLVVKRKLKNPNKEDSDG